MQKNSSDTENDFIVRMLYKNILLAFIPRFTDSLL